MAGAPVARTRRLATLLRKHRDDVALLVGNGVNRHGDPQNLNSWDALLVRIAQDCSPGLTRVPKGTALTEFFDVLELRSGGRTGELQREFCDLMADWRPSAHHRRIVRWARRHAVPVLTTNFDEALSRAAGCDFLIPKNTGFTDFYPWQCRFADELLEDPCAGFGIWHVNGMARYRRSIRLGLSHYMGSVQRARGWLHRSGDGHLFEAKDRSRWQGAGTWMHLVFNKPLLILGLALEENEVFLRWLLIERAKYFAKFPDRRKSAWYVFRPDRDDERLDGKLFFLRNMGVEPVPTTDYAEIYENGGWDD